MSLTMTRRWTLAITFVCGAWLATPAAQTPPSQPTPATDSVQFAVMGDNGTGDPPQYAVGKQMAISHATFPFTFVIMLGDNMYGAQRPQDYVTKFETPYKALLDAKIDFYAALGNHDDTNQRLYTPFNMGGKRYYTYHKGTDTRFFVLDSNYMDPPQVAWFEQQLKDSGSDWKIVYFHHPLYSSGMHGSQTDLRTVLEPLMVKYGVAAVFSGHEHFYQRVKPQKGITYFVSGAGGQLRKGDLQPSPMTAVGFDSDRSFMLIDITGKTLRFQAISRLGKVIDSGTLAMPEAPKTASGGGTR